MQALYEVISKGFVDWINCTLLPVEKCLVRLVSPASGKVLVVWRQLLIQHFEFFETFFDSNYIMKTYN